MRIQRLLAANTRRHVYGGCFAFAMTITIGVGCSRDKPSPTVASQPSASHPSPSETAADIESMRSRTTHAAETISRETVSANTNSRKPSLAVSNGINATAAAGESGAVKPWVGAQLASSKPTVVSVVDGSPAALAGLKRDDRIDVVNGKQVSSTEQVVGQLAGLKVGDKLELIVMREHDRIPLVLKLSAHPTTKQVIHEPR